VTAVHSDLVESAGESVDARRVRVVLYALTEASRPGDAYVARALAALRPHAGRLVVLSEAGGVVDAVRDAVDDVVEFAGSFRRRHYGEALDRLVGIDRAATELVLTGDDWYGPVPAGLDVVIDAMTASDASVWELVQTREETTRDFAPQGFPFRERPYLWVRLRADAVAADFWRGGREYSALAPRAEAAGFTSAAMFTASDLGSADPAVFAAERLVRAGSPVLPRESFTLYPPFLHQHAVIGRETLAAAAEAGFEESEILENLVRTVPPKALNTNLGMLDILVPAPAAPAPAGQRIAAVVHVSDLGAFPLVLEHLGNLPAGADLVVTCGDGRAAARLRTMLSKATHAFSAVDVRVVPANRGRDMSDLFIGCRDVILSGRYDIIVKAHARRMRRKTDVVRRYFRSYQLDNLLGSPSEVARTLARFESEPGLGFVFPPMIHIGYQTMGRGWAGTRGLASALAERLGIRVPLDVVSPLAPYGRMWFARAAALAPLAEHDWTYRDYGRAGRKQYSDLVRLQERILVAAAAERGFHARTVLGTRHASISHTALEYKVDELFSTTTGYPVDQITLVQRAGRTGYGGLVGLSRMYLRLNHPGFARLVMPLIDGMDRSYRFVRGVFGDDPRFRRQRTDREEDER